MDNGRLTFYSVGTAVISVNYGDIYKEVNVKVTNSSSSFIEEYHIPQTYINVMNRTMKYNVINQALGGYWFDEEYIVTMDGVCPDKILVSLGTNQLWSSDKYDRIDKFFVNLDKVYPNVPVFVITSFPFHESI